MDLSSEAFQTVPLLRLLDPVLEHGGSAVMLFWLISGFVFMNIYAGNRPGAWTFFVNRVSRLYPLHFATLIVIAILQFLSAQSFGHYMIYKWNDGYHFILQLFFASEWGMEKGRSFNGPIWSVSVEILIYVIFYFYIRFARISAASIIAILIGFLLLLSKFPANQLASCGAFFFGGAGVYALYAMMPARSRKSLAVVVLVGACIVTSVVLVYGAGPVPKTLWYLAIFGLAVLALALSEFTALSHVYQRLRILGDLTYSSYLWHSPLQMIFLLGVGFGFWNIGIVLTDMFVVSYVVTVMIVSYLSFTLIERPAQHNLRKLLLSRPVPKTLFSTQ